MSCGCDNKNLIEKYGDPHLHTGVNPLPVNEAEMHQCPGSCYYGDQWPSQEVLANSINSPQLVAINNSPDPKKRYGIAGGVLNTHDVGVGCMNLGCMCQNCQGDCKCPKKSIDYDQVLMYDKEVVEPFGFGSFQLEDQTFMYLVMALILFAAWYFLTKN